MLAFYKGQKRDPSIFWKLLWKELEMSQSNPVHVEWES